MKSELSNKCLRLAFEFLPALIFIYVIITRGEGMPEPIKVGTRERWSYAEINEVLDMPNLIQVQNSRTSGLLRFKGDF